jgi:hypothetical protein
MNVVAPGESLTGAYASIPREQCSGALGHALTPSNVIWWLGRARAVSGLEIRIQRRLSGSLRTYG